MLIKLVGVGTYGGLLLATGAISPEQRRFVWALARQPRETLMTLRGA